MLSFQYAPCDKHKLIEGAVLAITLSVCSKGSYLGAQVLVHPGTELLCRMSQSHCWCRGGCACRCWRARGVASGGTVIQVYTIVWTLDGQPSAFSSIVHKCRKFMILCSVVPQSVRVNGLLNILGRFPESATSAPEIFLGARTLYFSVNKDSFSS